MSEQVAVSEVRSAPAPTGGAGPAPLLAVVEDLEAGSGWRHDVGDLAQELLAAPEMAGAGELLRARTRLLAAIGLLRRGATEEAARTTQEIRDWAAAGGHVELQARAEIRLSVVFRRVGDAARSLEHAVLAVELGTRTELAALRCELLVALADALAECGSFEEASRRYTEAHELTEGSSTVRHRWLVLNNWAYACLTAGRPADAADLVDQLERSAAEHGEQLPLFSVHTVAAVRHALGRSAEAAAMLRAALERPRPDATVDFAAEAMVALAGIERELGDSAAAHAHLDRAERACRSAGLSGLMAQAMQERAELLAADGDHAGAYALHREFHAATMGLHAIGRETQARTLQAVYEVGEARRESARYRELSYRDALTGLFNRRYVDEDLDRRLVAGGHLALAMVDLDHFKQVNDRRSHEVGDQVLRQLADLLRDAAEQAPATGRPYAARLGGEEFLLVLPGVTAAEAARLAERLRRRIAEHDWDPITDGVPITASIGVACAPPEHPERASLLRTADRRLYRAKQAGRNRVEAEGPTRRVRRRAPG